MEKYIVNKDFIQYFEKKRRLLCDCIIKIKKTVRSNDINKLEKIEQITNEYEKEYSRLFTTYKDKIFDDMLIITKYSVQ